jgi:plastocyanin
MTSADRGETAMRLVAVFCVLASASAAFADEQPTGTIKGSVRFTGTVPEPKKIMTADGGNIFHSDLVVDPKSKGLRDVVVYLEDAPAQAKLENARGVSVDQRDWIFIPRVVSIQHGQSVRFENSDSVNHAVDATSFVKQNNFNITAGPGTPYTHDFVPQKQPVMIGCSLHPWMRAWIYVFPHSWHRVTRADGMFQIDRIPPGKYTLVLHHTDAKLTERRTIQIKPGDKLEISHDWKTAP